MTAQPIVPHAPTSRRPDCTDADDYDRARARWEAAWRDSFGIATIEGHGWISPWLDESWRDGNPIFSAWSASLGRGVRVLLPEDPGAFAHWEDTFGEGAEAVRELVIACALTDEAIDRAAEIWRRWAAEISPRAVTRMPSP